MTGICNVHGVFGKDDRIVIGKSDSGGFELNAAPCNMLRQHVLADFVGVAALRDVPVLAKLAG
jgi:hypothetical protein